MSTARQYIFDGDKWQSEVRAPRRRRLAAAPLNLWRPPQPQDRITGEGALFEKYKLVPCFTWIGDWNRSPQREIEQCVAAAAGRVVPLCVYGFPRSGYSDGGFNDLTSYKSWINFVSVGLADAPCILVLEPDALGLHTNMADGTTPETALSYAVTRFRDYNRQTSVYIDASHWIDAATQGKRLLAAGVARAKGFATNVSNFRTTALQVAYCESVNASLAQLGGVTKDYVIDTSRNGNGELTYAFGAAAKPWLDREEGWLNPPGRGLGLSPRAHPDPDRPHFAAALWIKGPGASDGNNPGSSWTSPYFPDRAPIAGSFWLSWMRDCLAHTTVSNIAGS